MMLIALIVAVQVSLFLAYIAFVIQGFRVHWGWGLANIFLFPLAGIALFIKHRQKAKIPMIIWVFSMTLLLTLLVGGKLGI